MGGLRRWLRRLFLAGVVFACAAVVLAAALVFSMRFAFVQEPLGQIITAIAQRPGHFFVRVGNVRGNPPWNVQVDRVEIGDAAGVWLVIEDAQADWHPFDVWHAFDDTHLRINVDRIHARRLLWTRLPVNPDEPGEKPFRWDRFPRIIAGDLVVDEFELGEGLLDGGHALLRAHGNGILGEWEHGRLDLALERIDGRRGQAKIDLYSDGRPPRFHGSVVAQEEPGGALAYVARLRDAGAVDLRVDTDGPLHDWSAHAIVDAGEIGKLDAKAAVAFGPTGAISITGTFDPVAQQRERYLVGAGAPMALQLGGAWLPDKFVRLSHGQLEADGRVLEASGRLDLASTERPFELAATLSRHGAAGENRPVQLGPMRLTVARLDAHGTLGAKAPDPVLVAVSRVREAIARAIGKVVDATGANKGTVPTATPGAPDGADATVAAAGGGTFTAKLEAEDFSTGEVHAGKLDGAVDGTQRVRGGPLAFNVDLRARDFASSQTTVPLLGSAPSIKGSGEAALGDGVVSFKQIDLAGDAVNVGGTLDVSDHWKGLRASLTARSEDLEALSSFVEGGIGGAATLGVQFDSKAGGQRFSAKLDGKSSGLTFGDPGMTALFGREVTVGAQADGMMRGPAKAHASVVADGVHIVGDAALEADGRTVSGTFTSVLENLSRLSDRAAAAIAGRLEATATLRGVRDNFSLRADVRGNQLVYESMRLDTLTAGLTADGLPEHMDAQVQAAANYRDLRTQMRARALMPGRDTLNLSDVVVEGPATNASANVSIDLRHRSISGTMKIACEELARWRPLLGRGLGGKLVADVAIPATAQGRASGTVALTNGAVVLPGGENIFVKSLNASGREVSISGEPTGIAHADLAGARSGGVTVDAATFDIAGDGKRWLVSTSGAGSSGLSWTVSARTTVAPKTSGTPLRQGGVAANVELLDFTFGADSVHLQEPTLVVWDPAGSISVAATTIGVDKDGKVRMSGQYGSSGVRAEAGLESVPLSILSFLAPDLGLRGTVGGSVSMRGPSLAAASADGHLDGHGIASHSLQESGVAPLDAVADARWAGGRLRGEASLGGLGKERVRLTVDAPLGPNARSHDPVSGALLWQGDVAEVAALLPIGEDVLKGGINANLQLAGTVASPLLSGDLSVTAGSYEHAATGMVLRDLELKLVAHGSSLVLERLTATDGEKGRLSAAGRADFANLPAFNADMELQASAATLTRLDIITSKGSTELKMRLARAAGAETVEGSVTGKVTIDEARINVPDRFAAAIPELKVIEVNGPGATGAAVGATNVAAPGAAVAPPAAAVAAPGAIAVPPGTVVTAPGSAVTEPGAAVAAVAAAVTPSGTAGATTRAAVAAPGSSVAAPGATVASPGSPVAAPGVAVAELQAHEPTAPTSNVAFDVAIKGNNRVFVKGRGLESEWSPDLRIGGTSAAPRVTGVVRSVRGTLSLLGKRFDVTNAELRFDGSPGAIPYLTLTAEARANDITAIIVAMGPATSPTIEFRSDPALPSDDVLARLLFGKGAASLTPMQSVQLAQSIAEISGLSLGGGPNLIDKLGRTIGLDRLGLESGSGPNAGSALGMSKYLTDKVYLSVQQGLTPKDSKASVEWEVFKNFRIQSDISQDAQGEVGASWRWDY